MVGMGERKGRGEWWQMRSVDNRPRSLRDSARGHADIRPHLEPSIYCPGRPLASPTQGPEQSPRHSLTWKNVCFPILSHCSCLHVDYKNKMWRPGSGGRRAYPALGQAAAPCLGLTQAQSPWRLLPRGRGAVCSSSAQIFILSVKTHGGRDWNPYCTVKCMVCPRSKGW